MDHSSELAAFNITGEFSCSEMPKPDEELREQMKDVGALFEAEYDSVATGRSKI